MPFIQEDFEIQERQKAFLWLMKTLHCSQREAQKILDKKRLSQNNLPIHKAQSIQGQVSLIHFIPAPIELPKLIQTPEFVIYNKPHKLLTHPKGLHPHPSLCDALKHEFGPQANPAHRLDSETAGLVLCSITQKSQAPLKALFENQKIQKSYRARVKGKIIQEQRIDAPILVPKKGEKGTNLSIRSTISPLGKPSRTLIKPLNYEENTDTTWLEVLPLSGRTHQIRAHLAHIGHPILGDPLYGCKDKHSASYLEKNLSDEEREVFFGSSFLHLWAYSLDFSFKDKSYQVSLQKF